MKTSSKIAASICGALFALLTVGAGWAEAEESATRIGVLSVAADKLLVQQIGVTAFGNEDSYRDIRALGLDATWEPQIAAAAKIVWDGAEVVDVEIDREIFFTARPPGGAKRGLDIESLSSELRRIAAESDLDFIILHSGAIRALPVGDITLSGPSLLTEKTFAGRNAYFWLITQVDYIDGASGRSLADKATGKGGGAQPARRVPKEMRGKLYSEYGAAEIETMRRTFAEMPEPYWVKTLEKLEKERAR